MGQELRAWRLERQQLSLCRKEPQKRELFIAFMGWAKAPSVATRGGPRGELVQSIARLEEEIANIEEQLEAEQRAIASRKTSFDIIVSELQTLRLMGKNDPDEEHDGDILDVPMGEDGEDEEGVEEEEDDPRRKRGTAAVDSTELDEKILDAESSALGTPGLTSLKLNPSARSFKPRQMSELGL
ncbi:hypothetical protein EXIGLDRAFT_705102 [Exidia glandulosa HHB12029]|uniref:Uncharacterized protein n=1 Tax=Exidia glandulosa HHB12029 TaxID=1314781 RepID=A0A165Z9B3_EXIGL|nr:hypothetical protein EXIGLDRAFT_705102 [Exidia glandulosa HHB12029]